MRSDPKSPGFWGVWSRTVRRWSKISNPKKNWNFRPMTVSAPLAQRLCVTQLMATGANQNSSREFRPSSGFNTAESSTGRGGNCTRVQELTDRCAGGTPGLRVSLVWIKPGGPGGTSYGSSSGFDVVCHFSAVGAGYDGGPEIGYRPETLPWPETGPRLASSF